MPDFMQNDPDTWLMGKSMHFAINKLLPVCIDIRTCRFCGGLLRKILRLGIQWLHRRHFRRISDPSWESEMVFRRWGLYARLCRRWSVVWWVCQCLEWTLWHRYVGNPSLDSVQPCGCANATISLKHLPAALANYPGFQRVSVWLNLQNLMSYFLEVVRRLVHKCVKDCDDAADANTWGRLFTSSGACCEQLWFVSYCTKSSS